MARVKSFHFRHIPRRNRAKGLVPRIKRYSKQFKCAVAAGDEKKQSQASEKAWDAMTKLFEILRGEQDDGYLAADWMNVDTALIVESCCTVDIQDMMALRKIDRTRATKLSLRNTLNKIAHYRTATFRVDGRNAHYILLEGSYRNTHWIAEVLISKLCKHATAAIHSITG